MRRSNRLLMVLCLGLSSACFHQVVQTGRPAGNKTIDKPFVSTWIFGLVPATEMDLRRECPSGIASVTTEQSFINGLVSVVTLGIYTPQHASITCASGTASVPVNRTLTIPADASEAQASAIVRRAVERAEETDTPMYLRF